jgi:hypothetical protein
MGSFQVYTFNQTYQQRAKQIVVGFIATYAISTYHHLCVLDKTLCDKVRQ